jgi:CHAD domain-containing protein
VSFLARRALDSRLHTVLRLFPLVTAETAEQPKQIHQLRVATRRAVAALDLFEPLVGRRKHRNLRRKLRRVRKETGAAREIDVLTEQVQSSGALTDAERDAVGKSLTTFRQESRRSIAELSRRLPERKLRRRIESVRQGVRWRGEGKEPAADEYSVLALTPLVEMFLSEVDYVSLNFQGLHRFRVQGKKLRYAIELLAGEWPRKLRGHFYSRLEELQNRLGDINDLASAETRCLTWATAFASEAAAWEKLATWYRHAGQAALAEFAVWWSTDRIAEFKNNWQLIQQKQSE